MEKWTRAKGLQYDDAGMLMDITSGLSYLDEDMDGLQKDLIGRWEQANRSAQPWGTLRVAKELAHIPLKFGPGTEFEYSLSLDVMGTIIEVVTGQNLNQYCAENIFMSLEMKETSWALAEKDESRLVKC